MNKKFAERLNLIRHADKRTSFILFKWPESYKIAEEFTFAGQICSPCTLSRTIIGEPQRGDLLAFLEFRNVGYSAGSQVVLQGLSLEVERGETLVLLGRSGSGKTTALRLINRLLEASSGSILLDGQDNREMDPIALRRQIGYVIQEFGLMPHWTVEQNVSLMPRLLDWPAERQGQRARELLDQVGLGYESVRSRYPQELSGGQRQRVAVARALAVSPALLLFDEPFGALDPITRREMQQQLLRLRDQYQVASVFVTHDIAEALAIGTRIAVLSEGRLEVVATPSEFFQVQTPTAAAFRSTLAPDTVAAWKA